MSFVNWMFNNFNSEDVIDLYFVLSDLVDIDLTEDEKVESAYFDSLTTATVESADINPNIPIGKQVL